MRIKASVGLLVGPGGEEGVTVTFEDGRSVCGYRLTLGEARELVAAVTSAGKLVAQRHAERGRIPEKGGAQ